MVDRNKYSKDTTSYSDNYTYNFIYNTTSQDTTKFNFYVYSLN